MVCRLRQNPEDAATTSPGIVLFLPPGPSIKNVAPRLRCPRCGAERPWILRDGRRRCGQCRYDWRPGRLPLRLAAPAWRELLRWFVRGAPSAQIAHEARLDRKRVLRALTVVRQAIMRSGPQRVLRVTKGASGGHAKESQHVGPQKSAKALGSRFSMIGLYLVHGLVGADVIPEGREAEQLGRMLRGQRARQLIAPPELRCYAAVVHRGRFYRLTTAGHPVVGFGRIEAFWGYLQGKLRAKGGIRRERLELYLAEYVWRYNRRHLSPAEQLRELLELIRQQPAGGTNRTFPQGKQGPRASMVSQRRRSAELTET
jgi:transposase-like protein